MSTVTIKLGPISKRLTWKKLHITQVTAPQTLFAIAAYLCNREAIKLTLEPTEVTTHHQRATVQAITFMTVLVPFFREWNPQPWQSHCHTKQLFLPPACPPIHQPVVPPLLSPSLTHICSVFLMKRKVMVPPWLIRGTEMHIADRLVIESGGKRQHRPLRAPTSIRGGNGEKGCQEGR